MRKSKKVNAIVGAPDLRSPHRIAVDTTVLLLGWAGAQDKHVAKHAEIYNNKGFKTIMFNSAFDGKHPLYLKTSRDIDGLVPTLDSELADPGRRLLIHTYSMNGVFTLCTLLYHKRFIDLLKRTDGLTMDRRVTVI
ncbi:unnamed protein product, partial [Mesorhabditis spiculigera]